MDPRRSNPQAFRRLWRSAITHGHFHVTGFGCRRHLGQLHRQARKVPPRDNYFRYLVALGLAGGLFQSARHFGFHEVHAEAPPAPVEVKIERTRKTKGLSKEDNRDQVSSQHLQVKRSWENPGVYAWGSNTGRVVAPESDDAVIKAPRRIPFFDDVLLRDIKLDQDFAAAITEQGDLLQWGTAYSEDSREPTAIKR